MAASLSSLTPPAFAQLDKQAGGAAPAARRPVPHSGPLFDAPVSYPLGEYPNERWASGIRLADLDHDGDLDAVIGRTGSTASALSLPCGITVTLNRGDGSFQAPAYYGSSAMGTSSDRLEPVIADFDADGNVDAAIAAPGAFAESDKIAVFRGIGDGTFAAPVLIPTDFGPQALVAGDFNGDGNVDLVTTIHGYIGQGSTVSVLLGNGDGTFQAASSYAAGLGPERIKAGDLDGDGDLDLALSSKNQRLNLLFNDGTGAFNGPVEYVLGSGTTTCEVGLADSDGDGDLDVFFTGPPETTNGNFLLLRNDGMGTLAPQLALPMLHAINPNYYYGALANTLHLTDFDHDGWVDLVGQVGDNTMGAGWLLCLNKGDGTFHPAERVYSGGHEPQGLATGDVNGDGATDVLSIGRNSMELVVYLNPGDNDLEPELRIDQQSFGRYLAVPDVDLDGDRDVVTGGGSQVNVYANDGAGHLALIQQLPSAYGDFLKAADVSGDGAPDLVWMHDGPPYYTEVSINDGAGAFLPQTPYPIQNTGAGDLGVFDIDGDGDLDKCVTCMLAPLNRFVSISPNNGDGSFQPDYLVEVDLLPRKLEGADLDGNGTLDLITSHYAPGSCCGDFVNVLSGNGDGTFLPPYRVETDFDPREIAARDLNGDGYLDLATVNTGSPGTGGTSFPATLSILLGHGDGTFAPKADVMTSYSSWGFDATGMTTGDVDGDGDIDIAVSSFGSESVVVHRNRGDATFGPLRRYAVTGAALDVRIEDLTGDGAADLVITSEDTAAPKWQRGLTVLRGRD